MLPGLTGIELMRRLKRTSGMEQIPIIMLTAKSEEADKLKGFAHGADDYITKPFSLSELKARIKALLYRTKANAVSEEIPGFQFLSDEKKVIVQGNIISLTKSEFKLLEYLYNNRHKVCSRAEIIEHCWEKDVYDRVILRGLPIDAEAERMIGSFVQATTALQKQSGNEQWRRERRKRVNPDN